MKSYYEDLDGVGERFARSNDGDSYTVPKDMNYQSWKAYNKAVTHEANITDMLRALVEETGHELSGLEFRVKTPESFTQKINKEAAEYQVCNPETTYEKSFQYATSRMYDAVRYTALAENNEFTEKYKKAVNFLQGKGYNINRVKNSLPDIGAIYRGVNTVVTAPDGFNFELQFHMPESLEVKNKTHLLYEEAREAKVSTSRIGELEAEMKALTRKLQTPKGAETILSIDNLKGW